MTLEFPPLEEWQKEVFDAMEDAPFSGKIFCVKAKRQVGKTILVILELIKFAVCTTDEFGNNIKTINCLIEPTLSQSRRCFKQIVSILTPTNLIKKSNESLLTIEWQNGSEILFKSAEQRDSLRGMTISGVLCIDEMAFINDEIIQLLYPTVDVWKAPILMVSTPLFTDSLFYKTYIDGLQGKNNTISFDWSTYDTSKYLSEEKLNQYKEMLSPMKFKSEYLGEFITSESFVFGNFKDCIKPYSQETSIYCGIDWGSGNGGDYTVLIMLDRFANITKIEAFNNIESTKQIEIISEIINNTPSLQKVQVEINSIGRIFADALKKNLKRKNILREFSTNNDSKRRVIEQIIKAFGEKKIGIVNDTQLITQLQHYQMEKLKNGYTFNAEANFHDDYCIALALAYDLTLSSTNNYRIKMF